MEIRCLYEFKNATEFIKFTDFTKDLEWKIEKQLLKDRVNKYRKLDKFISFKNSFNRKKLSIFDLKPEEVITWFDTSLLVRRIILKLFEKGVNTDNISIIMEYPVVFGNHMRTDYLLVMDRLIVVLEFGMFNQDERRSTERYTKKLQESISYRQIIENMMPNQIKVINYVMIYKPEYDDVLKITLNDKIKYNKQEIEKLSLFLEHHINLELSYNSKYQLKKISKFL